MCAVSNDVLLLFNRFVDEKIVDVTFGYWFCMGDDGGEIRENNFLERDEDPEE